MLLEVMGSQQGVPVKAGDVVVGQQETKVQEKRDRVGKDDIQAAPQYSSKDGGSRAESLQTPRADCRQELYVP